MPTAVATRPWSVLVVEDDADTSKQLRRFLEHSGYLVRCAATVQEAIEKLSASSCDALVSDIGLPDGTGWDLMEKAHLPASVYAVAMSGFAMQTHRIKSLEAGFRQHLTKPFNPHDLIRLLEEARLRETN